MKWMKLMKFSSAIKAIKKANRSVQMNLAQSSLRLGRLSYAISGIMLGPWSTETSSCSINVSQICRFIELSVSSYSLDWSSLIWTIDFLCQNLIFDMFTLTRSIELGFGSIKLAQKNLSFVFLNSLFVSFCPFATGPLNTYPIIAFRVYFMHFPLSFNI